MISIKSNGSFVGAGLISAIAASLCCITPVMALMAGSSTIAANFSWIEPARPYLIALTIGVLSFAWYLKLKPIKSDNMDCCQTDKKRSFIQSKSFLGIVTLFAGLMLAFPMYARVFYPKPMVQAVGAVMADKKQQVKFIIQGMTCEGCEEHVNKELASVKGVLSFKTSYAAKSSIVTFDPSVVNEKEIEAAINKTGYKVKGFELIKSTNAMITYYEAPLVCAAAPSIGCGSKAKFLLVDLEGNNEAIKGAWLNEEGTVIAVEWNEAIDPYKREKIINTIGKEHNIGLFQLQESEQAKYAKSFPQGSQWFRGAEVDKLSRQEASIIAANTIKGYKKEGLIKPSFEKQFQADIEKIYADLFLSISSYNDLSIEAYNKVESQIQKAGEKYVGKGKMPYVELCVADDESKSDKSCSKEGSESCCEKQ